MRNLIVAGLFAATVVLGAQSQSSQPSSSAQQPSTQPSSSAAQDMPVTVTGCLTASADQKTFTLTTAPRASARSAGASGDTGGSAGGSSSATGGATATAGSTGTSGSTATQVAAVPTITYTLVPQASVDLKSHVNHTVEVTGTQPPQKQTVAGSLNKGQSTTEQKADTGGKQPTVTTTETTRIVARELNVTAVKDLAGDCRVAK